MSQMNHNVGLGGDEVEPAVSVVNAVAAKVDKDPLELPPMYHAIDPDVLTDIFAGTGDSNRAESVQFTYLGYLITVFSDGEVKIQ